MPPSPLPGPIRTAHYVKQGGMGTESKCPRVPTAGFCPSPLSERGQQVRLYPGHLAAETEGTFCSVSARVSQTINLRPPPCPASCLLLTRPGDSVSSLLNEKSPPGLSPSHHSNLTAGHGALLFAWRVPAHHLTGRCAIPWGDRRGGRCRAQGHLAPGHSRSLPAQRNRSGRQLLGHGGLQTGVS